MPAGPRRHRVVALLLAAFAAALVLAATAAAETKTGESSSPISQGAPGPETSIVKGSASYDTASGSIRFDITTAAAPQAGNELWEESESSMMVALLSLPGECSIPGLAAIGSNLAAALPIVEIVDQYWEPTPYGELLLSSVNGTPIPLAATRSVSGATTTLSLTSSAVAGKGFNCALLEATETAGSSLLLFPLVGPPPAPPVVPPPAPAPVPPAPPALSIAKPKPLKLKVGKWQTVRVRVKNTGATATGSGSLRVKAPKGVLVKPERQQLPVLAPGGSWTVSVRVELTEKAKKTSKLSLTAAASGVTDSSSFVLRLKR